MLQEATLSRLSREYLVDLLSDRLRLRLRPLAVPNLGGRRVPPAREKQFDMAFELEGVRPRRRLHVEVKPRLLRQHIRAFLAHAKQLRHGDPSAVPLLMVPRLSSRSRDELREAGINHADLRGILFIRDPGLYVDLEAAQSESWPSLYRPHGINPFADKASFVLRALLGSSQRIWRITEISAQGQLTKGWVSVVAAELVQRGYVERANGGLRLVNPISVLKDWSAVYSWRRNRIESYVAPFEYHELLAKMAAVLSQLNADWALTLLAGADHVAPHVQHGQVHAYLAPVDYGRVRSAVREKLHLEPVGQGGNLHLLDPHYAKSGFFGRRQIGEVNVVSDLQLYLDLVEYPVRGAEAAEMLLRRSLGPTLGLDPRQISELL